MNLKPIRQNMNEVNIGSKRVLFSYQTPVAYQECAIPQIYVTSKFWSNTTSRHINQWLNVNGRKHFTELCHNGIVKVVDQSVLDNLLNEVK